MNGGEILMKLDNLGQSFGEKVVLRNVNGEIKNIIGHGQVVGLLGPSGVGKTSLLRILAGLQKPTTGSASVFDQASGKETPIVAGAVGVVAQNYPLFWHHSVYDNLFLAGRSKGLPVKDVKERIEYFLNRFNLTEQMYSYPRKLSGGQRQRIAIIQQLLSSDHYILMDEPFSGLDPINKAGVVELIQEVANLDELNTIIVVTHDIAEAIGCSDTLWLMGRDKDTEGKYIPGAYIKEKYDLVERNLAWHKDISLSVEFSDFVREIKKKFKEL